MKSFTSFVALALASSSLAQEIRNPQRQAKYVNGEVHEAIMARKNAHYDAQAAAGAYNSSRFPSHTTVTRCIDGRAGEFRCSNVDLYSFYSHADLGSVTGQGSSSWGWTHKGREYIIIAQADGAAFAEVTRQGQLVYLGRLPSTPGTIPRIWREIRVIGHYAIIGTEIQDHHVQIFDLLKLVNIPKHKRPVTFNTTTDLTGLWTGAPIGRTHTITTPPSGNYFVANGAQPRNSTYKGGLIFVGIEDPSNPTILGYQADDGYVHDAQCLPYKGPDTKYQGREVCYGYNEDTLTIYDVTNKANATIISRTGYVGANYTHQGWVLDPEDQRFLVLDDELDEVNAVGPAADGFPVTYIWNIESLEAPRQTGFYKSSIKGIDHNQYVANGKSYQSNYGAGLRIIDVSSIPRDPTGAGVHEVGFIDIFPEDDAEEGGGQIEFQGTWSSYALFKSGFIIINTIERGAYVVRYTGK